MQEDKAALVLVTLSGFCCTNLLNISIQTQVFTRIFWGISYGF
jgi:hypothetical protein